MSEGKPHGGDGRDAGDEALADDLTMVGNRDLTALRRVYQATGSKLLSLCLRITGSREAAEDVLQEVYIKVWNRAAGYDRERARPMAWLATIARNSAIDFYRAQSRRKTDDLLEVSDIRDDAKPIDEELIDQQELQQAISLIEELDPQQREHIRDVYFNGLSYAELSKRDGVPLGTIKSRVHRALNLLNCRFNGG